MQFRSILSFALPLLLAACNSQADSDYPGEALLKVQGTIINELDAPPTASVDAVLIWNNGSDPGNDVENFPTRVTVTGGFPATFTLAVYAPPPESSLNDLSEGGLDDTRVGIAGISAAESGASGVEGSALGVDERHVIVYVESDMAEGGFWVNFFGQRLAPGFHVMDALPHAGEEQQAAFDACMAAAATEAAQKACNGHDSKIRIRPSAEGESTPLTVRMAPAAELSWPDWH